MSSKNHATLYFFLALFWSGVIFAFSAMPTLPSATKIWWDYLLKKSAHITEYFILFLFTYKALKPRVKRPYLIAFTYCFLYAASDEFHQSFVPGRHPSPLDVGFDTIGATASYMYHKKLI